MEGVGAWVLFCWCGLKFFAGACGGVADLGFEVVVEMFQCVAEGLVALLDSADQHSTFEVADDEGGCFVDVNVWLYRSDGDAFAENFFEAGLPAAEGFADALAEDRVAVVGVDRCVEQRATAWQAGADGEVENVLFEAIDVIGNDVDFVETFGDGVGPGEVEGFGGDLFLTVEVTVDAAFFEAGCGHNVLEATALVAALVEERSCQSDDALAGCFAFAHSCDAR